MPVQGKGRLCGTVGCNVSLEGRSANARYCRACSLLRKRASSNAPKRSSPATLEKQAKARKSLRPFDHEVSGKKYAGETHKAKTVLCGTCGGMSWRRDTCTALGVLCCVECRLRYEPEPPMPRMSVLGSSAGTAVRAGALYGAERLEGGGHHGKK